MDIKPLLKWVKENGEARAVERLLMKSMLSLISYNFKFSASEIENMEIAEVESELFEVLKIRAEEIIGMNFESEKI